MNYWNCKGKLYNPKKKNYIKIQKLIHLSKLSSHHLKKKFMNKNYSNKSK